MTYFYPTHDYLFNPKILYSKAQKNNQPYYPEHLNQIHPDKHPKKTRRGQKWG
ncbi:MAG: hypothetical protein F6K48_21415 [Okeania sp. SIO3H1]|nr:hypothetical protein [Okeania sp. SIO3H1]